MLLQQQSAIITGGASGIGLATVELFLQQQATVHVFDVASSAALEALQAANATLYFHAVDVTDEANVAQAVADVIAQSGKIDILFNNAGIGSTGKIHEIDKAHWDRVMGVNITGVYLMAKYVVEEMLRAGRGNIINMSSCIAEIGLENRAAYAATKGAVLALTKSMQVDYAANNIRVNALLPGTVYTPFVEKYVNASSDPEATLNSVKKRQLTSELGRPEDIAQAVLFLATDQSKFMMGSPLYVDGGVTFGKKTT